MLMHWTGSEWQELLTAKVDENETHVIYEATTPGFSIFAITGQVVLPQLPTYILLLPTGALSTGQVTITVRVANPSASTITKHCELRIGQLVALPLNIQVGAGESSDFPLTLDVAGVTGTYTVELYDLDESKVLDSESLTLGQATQPEGQPAETTPPAGFPLLPLAAIAALACAAAVTAFAIKTGRLRIPKLTIPKRRVTRPKRAPKVAKPVPKAKPPAPVTRPAPEAKPPAKPRQVAPVVAAYRGMLEPVARELMRREKPESELGEDYLSHLTPIAYELATQKVEPKRIQHSKAPVTPFKIHRAGRSAPRHK